jgi:hypothetical protein
MSPDFTAKNTVPNGHILPRRRLEITSSDGVENEQKRITGSLGY